MSKKNKLPFDRLGGVITINRRMMASTAYLARHPTSCNSGTPVALINSLTERLGNALVRPASASTSHKSRYVKATSNGLTAIRNAILASLACS